MNPLLLTVSPQAEAIAHALGWTLLHFLWQGTLVAVILGCLLALLSERSPQPRYAAACTALVLMATLPVITFSRLLAQEYRDAHAITTVIPLDPITIDATSALSEPLFYRLTAALDRSMPVLLALWFAGVLLLLGRLSMGLIIARQMKSLSTEPPTHELLSTFRRLTHRIGVSRPVRLLHSALVQVPTVIGWLRPVVLIPFGCLAGLSPTQLEAILAHELAHIRRHDYLISVLQSVVEALLFYHPAVWWVSRRIRTEREHCCDDLAVRIGGDPLTYARALSLLAERSSALPAIALGANGGILTMRIKRLLTPKEGPATSQLAAVTLLGIVIAATGLCIGTAARAQAKPTPATAPTPAAIATPATPATPATAQLTSSNATPAAAPAQASSPSKASNPAYQKWLDEDVRWIITPSERATFLQLTTDQDRDNFIQNFWDSRNPVGSAPNTFRSEHYRRIAYANQHFTEGNTPGWATERGRMYIINGEPNTIDRKPAADGHTSEIWHYSSTQGSPQGPNQSSHTIELKFVDQCNCGTWHLEAQSSAASSSSSSSSSSSHSESSLDPPPAALRSPLPPTPAVPASPAPKTPAAPKTLAAPKPAAAQINRVSYVAVPAAPAPQSPPPSNDSKSLRVSSGIMAGQVITRVTPIYPSEAKTSRIQGAVVLHAIISAEGDVSDLEVLSGPPELRNSAMQAVLQWKYKPYLLNGQPKAVDTTITINYSFDTADGQNSPPPPDGGRAARAADGTIPKHIGGPVSAPKVISQVIPEFSDEAKKDKTFTGGKVLVHLLVDVNGNPQHVRVVRGVGEGLDEKAVEAVKQYKFTPAMENGKPVLVELNIEVNFQRF